MPYRRFTASIEIGALMGAFFFILFSAARSEEISGSWWRQSAVMSCCSEGDALWADAWRSGPDGSVIATVTGGGPRDHAWAPIGRTYAIPPDRVKAEPGNPTGHGVLFLNPADIDRVICFLPGAGI